MFPMLNNYKKFFFLLLVLFSLPCFAQQNDIQQDSEPTTSNIFFRKDIHLPPHNIYAVTGLGTINSDNFWGNIKIKSGYLNYNFYPFYLGGVLGFEIGIANKAFPFHLKVNGVDTGAPIMLTFAPAAIGGIHYLFEKPEILAFFELELGMNIRMLSSSNIQYPYVGNATPSFFADFALGAEWKCIRAAFDIQLDTELVYSIGGTLGTIFKLP